jgi:predicted HD phosphohydrolase
MINEPITQQQHAQQTYQMMKIHELGSKRVDLRVAAFLHDIGHLTLNHDPLNPEDGKDDQHELVGVKWLALHGFPPSVYLPVMFHVDAKRYMCTKNPKYRESLSEGSQLSLNLQGGAMSQEELTQFEKMPNFNEIMLLRYCDDLGKNVDLTELPPLEEIRNDVLSVLK